jgi:hypothetical protein
VKFTIAFKHRRATALFIVKAEMDGIFIAFPKLKRGTGEEIFLTKTGGQWVGDSHDKLLVRKIGREIDALLQQKAKPA